MSTVDRSHEQADRVFQALADPTRRAVISRLSTAHGLTPTELAAGLPISRQAVAKHLATLDAAGLVHRRREGRETRYQLQAAPLTAVIAWLGEVGGQWDRRLARLAALVSDEG